MRALLGPTAIALLLLSHGLLAAVAGCEAPRKGDPTQGGTVPVAPTPPPAGRPAPPPPPPKGAPQGSGAMLQDPTGFPHFHGTPPAPGPHPAAPLAGMKALQITSSPAGGYRPQIAVGPEGTLHAVYYDRVEAGDIVRYRQSRDGLTWSAAETVSEATGRNWGPDLVVRADGSVVVVYDHAEDDFRSRGWLRVRDSSGWGSLMPLTPEGAVEMGSGHVAHAEGADLAYVHIRKPLGAEHRFQAIASWRKGDRWEPEQVLSDGGQDAWHSNVERRPDASVLIGFDLGVGGTETNLMLVDGRDGRFGAPESLSATSHPGERPNFAFLPGLDIVTWFRKQGGFPRHIYVRTGRPGAWGATEEPSAGIAGYHFDPDIAVRPDGLRCLVWGWDGGEEAELVYSLWKAASWSPVRQVARVGWGKPGLPSIDVDQNGAFHVVWTQGVRGSNEVYYARISPDAG